VRRIVFPLAVAWLAIWLIVLAVRGPALAISHDELNFLFESLRLPAQRRLGSFMHGPLTFELLALVEMVAFAAMKLARAVHTPVEFLASVLLHLRAHLAIGRLIIGVFAVGCLFQLRRLAERFSAEGGAVAAWLCAVNLTFLVFASMLKEDILFWFLTLWSLNQTWDLDDARRPRRAAFLAGATIGVAFSTKYFGIFGVLLFAVPLVRRGRAALPQALHMALGAGFAVLLTFPFLITQTGDVLWAVRRLGSATAQASSSLALWPVLSHHLPNLLGWVALPFALYELGWRLVRDRRGPIWLGIVPAAQFLFLTLRPGHTEAYYFAPLVLFAMALAAAGAARLHRLAPLALVAASLASFVYLRGSLSWATVLLAPDTRELARERVESLVPAGSRVLVTGAVAGASHFGPPLVPDEPPAATGSGAFAAGEALAIARRPGPRYHVKLVNGFEPKAADAADVDWIVAGRFGELSHSELGEGHPWVGAAAELGSGFEPVAEIAATPPIHTYAFPCLTILDYEELSQRSLSELLWHGARGPSFTIYRRRAAPALH
jgi:hypothetical protein